MQYVWCLPLLCCSLLMFTRCCTCLSVQNHAFVGSLLSVINQQAGADSQPLFPKTCLAAQASSLLAAAAKSTGSATASVACYIAAAEAAGKRELWTRSVPTNMLLLIPGQGVGAVADLMSVELDESVAAAPAVTLTLDVVHKPHMVNEFTHHNTQTLDDDAHYHYFTPAGVSVDAAKFLAALKASGNHLKGEQSGYSSCNYAVRSVAAAVGCYNSQVLPDGQFILVRWGVWLGRHIW